MKKQEIIKERNELAKQLLLNTDFDSKYCFTEATEMISLLYGENWDYENDCQPDTVPIVSIAEQDGQKGVRFCIGDVDVFIEDHDFDAGKKHEWRKAMIYLKEVGKETFSHKECLLMAAYRYEINAALRDIGGDELKRYYWTSTEWDDEHAWGVNFSNGDVTFDCDCYSFPVRACSSFKGSEK